MRQGSLSRDDQRAFHAHIATINGRRIIRLAAASSALLLIGAALNLVGGAGLFNPNTIRNCGGAAVGLLILALARWSPRPGVAPLAYGYAVLAWGDTIVPAYVAEAGMGHATHAAQQFVLYFITRYLAAMSVIWRPRDLALALALNHLVAAWILLPRGIQDAFFFPGLWTTTAWLVAYLIYRAERDAFVARTGLQQQRDELAAANEHLERLNQEKNDLMAIAAHDLRSPLMGMTTLLAMAADDASRAWSAGVSTLKTLEQSGRDMATLVTRVLDAHQTDDRLGQLSIAAGDITPVVTRTMAAHEAMARAKGITLVVTADQPCVALHDPHALGRVIDNLGSNAIKFSTPGASVRVAVHPGVNGDGPRIQITDGGPGITDEERPRLFRKFARLRARPTAGESSSGLGLYIVKRLVDAMGGSIDVTSGDGGGASFIVTLAPQTPSESPGSISR